MRLGNKKCLNFFSISFILTILVCKSFGSNLSYSLNTNSTKNILANNFSDDDNKTAIVDRILSEYFHISNGCVLAIITSMIIVLLSEMGDKSFLIAVVMSMKHSRLLVFISAMCALELMTLISAMLGNIITQFVPKVYIFFVSIILFASFGFKMLYEAYYMHNGLAQPEVEELESLTDSQVNNIPKVFMKAFALIFLAEWGDRSQISIMILGARKNIVATLIGCTIGNALCTFVAVVGGRFIGEKISVRLVTLMGALFFLVFSAADAVYFCVYGKID